MKSSIGLFAMAAIVAGLSLAPAMSAADTSQFNDTLMLQDIQADLAQTAGLTGKGVKVGVISDGAYQLSQVQSAGALPSVTIIGGTSGQTSSEGVGMLEIVHQIAPDATLYYCDSLPMPICVQTMVQTYGVQVIVDDVSQDTVAFAPSQFSFMYDQLLQTYPSLVLIHAGGNFYLTNNFNVWTPMNVKIAGTTYAVQDYGKAAGGSSQPYQVFTLNKGDSVHVGVLWSDDPDVTASTGNNIMAIWVLDTSNNVLSTQQGNLSNGTVSTTYVNNTSSVQTVRVAAGIATQNNTFPMAVQVFSDSDLPVPAAGGAGTEYGTSDDTLIVGAIDEQAVGTGGGTIEAYSDQGPVLQYWSASQIGTDPTGVAELSYTRLTTPVSHQKPDLTGTDCNQVYATNSFKVISAGFCGSSAAAPTVAGAAALLIQATQGSLTRTDIINALESSASHALTGVKTNDWDGQDGYGLIQTWDAIKTLINYPVPAITAPAAAATIDENNTVSFAGKCTETNGSVASYKWEFGDGASSTAEDPGAHEYTKSGTFTATFTCTDKSGITNPVPASVQVKVSAPAPAKSGGGALGPFVLALLSLALVRRRVSVHRVS